MAVEEFYDNFFKTAAGWLSWNENEILDANLNNLALAIEGKVEFVKKTNPFGSGEGEDEDKKLRESQPNPEVAMQQLIGMVKSRQANQVRKKKR